MLAASSNAMNSAKQLRASSASSCRSNCAQAGGCNSRARSSVRAAAFSLKSSGKNKSRDATAELLGSAINAALQGRLKQCKGIDVDVRSTAMALMSGEFGGMSIQGRRWVTPLDLTAERIEVEVGQLLIDYTALVLQQKVQLRNIPAGACTITLTSEDLGNFMTHPLMLEVSHKCIKDKSFHFDKDSVMISKDSQGRGYVDLEGIWELDNQRYKMRMVPLIPDVPKGAIRLHVSAKRLLSSTAMDSADGSVLPNSNASAVAHGMAKLFSSLSLNLQGVELKSPLLRVLLPGASNPDISEPLMQISMKLKIRSVPPLDMKF